MANAGADGVVIDHAVPCHALRCATGDGAELRVLVHDQRKGAWLERERLGRGKMASGRIEDGVWQC